MMEDVLRSAHALAQDQYGNYVIQHVLEHGSPQDKSTVRLGASPSSSAGAPGVPDTGAGPAKRPPHALPPCHRAASAPCGALSLP